MKKVSGGSIAFAVIAAIAGYALSEKPLVGLSLVIPALFIGELIGEHVDQTRWKTLKESAGEVLFVVTDRGVVHKLSCSQIQQGTMGTQYDNYKKARADARHPCNLCLPNKA